jgi:predicted SAM-dependent methyltransferase
MMQRMFGIRSRTVRRNESTLRHLVESMSPVCLNLGSGERYFPGWINIDSNPYCNADVVMDLTKGIDLPDETVDYIFNEDFLEHLDQASGKRFLENCHRILKPTGVMRLLTPNLRTFALAYINRSEKDLAWYTERFGATTHAEMFNLGMRSWGHTFIYDEETLLKTVLECGFKPQRVSFNESEKEQLCGLDFRNSGEDSHTMYFELRKA